MTKFHTILIANRGEIACRVIRTAKALGMRTVAVYSDADANAPHVHLADDAAYIGPAPVNESYLVGDKIIRAALEKGVQAVHPGYGFLSENADFGQACADAGLVFIGPSAHAIQVMGNKAEAKRRMIEAQVPCVPGYEGKDQSDDVLIGEGDRIGYPLMVKAAAGGGGRGMRLVEKSQDLPNALNLARSEAENAFGSGELILEKAIIRPRHVEVQVFGDAHGNVIHLGERDCSVQRRHQKVVEEAPCPVMTPELRARMGEAAVNAAKSIDYVGAGTVEFLLDGEGQFYFLEMNTRLQVEHPVTECITGLDLVALQIRVAEGEELGLTQSDVDLNGHAIEVRLYAEDPAQDFLPATGKVSSWQPAVGEGIRIDSGIASGLEISPFYDPMVAKIIASGASREIARRRLIEALKETTLFGTVTNKEFLIACLEKETFAKGEATTAFIGEEFTDQEIAGGSVSLEDAAVAAVLAVNLDYQRYQSEAVRVAPSLKNWSSASPLTYRKHFLFAEDADFNLSIVPLGQDRYAVLSGEQEVTVLVESFDAATATVVANGQRKQTSFKAHSDGELFVSIDGHTNLYRDLIALAGAASDEAGGGRVVAPMHGMLLEVFVEQGQRVSKGDRLAILEAMKMQHEILAEVDGTVSEIAAAAGNQIGADDLILEIEEDNEEAA